MSIEAITGNEHSGLDLVAGQHFTDDDALLDAATRAEMERSSPEYKAIRARLTRELEAKRDRERRAQYTRAFEETLSTTNLNDFEQKQVDERSLEMAQRDLAAGRIFSRDVGKRAAEYAEKLSDEAKRTKASNSAFNSLIRAAMRGGARND